jgi:hypothetical protein
MQSHIVCAAILPAITGKLPQARSRHIIIFVVRRITTDYGKNNTPGQEYKTL